MTTTETPEAEPLTAGQLCDLLSRFPRDHIVVLSADADGTSGYAPAADVVEGMYAMDDHLCGTAYPTSEVLARDEQARRTFGALPDDAVPAVVLYPTD
ncbi:hypothetical protein [Streptomyces sp. MS2.AVA.5]|uniref:Uncharacterized protein n=1 Tax=Streptomyces achmelvichensis TaxID=3134111 RepID=A0ACC6Q9F6_9ACTN